MAHCYPGIDYGKLSRRELQGLLRALPVARAYREGRWGSDAEMTDAQDRRIAYWSAKERD